jgi:hypothetical protein
MEQFRLLQGIYNKQIPLIRKLYDQVRILNLRDEDKPYVFALKTQQMYTAIEDLLKSTAKSFENHIDEDSGYHIELLRRMSTDVPRTRPAVLSDNSYKVLDKLRSFRHFIRHAYNYELDIEELSLLQNRLNNDFDFVLTDLTHFNLFLDGLEG